MAARTARKRIQWSKEPDEAPDYSDWKITLAKKCTSPTEETPSTVTFSVHRSLLGPQSEYFTRIFKSSDSAVSNNNNGAGDDCGAFSESKNQHSVIDLPPNISDKAFDLFVKAFETLLGYCYLEDVDFKGTSPVPLFFLCDYFQMEDDFESKVYDYTENLLKKMASETKLHPLYEDIIEFRAAGLNVERAQKLTARICYEKKNLLSKGTQFAIIADLPLWLDTALFINKSGHDGRNVREKKSASKDWSSNIANFLENNDNSSTVDFNAFQKLTDEKVLPYVDANAALVLLKEEQNHTPTEVNNGHIKGDGVDGVGCVDVDVDVDVDGDGDGDGDGDVDTPISLQLTNLQKRCVESFVYVKLELKANKYLSEKAIKVMSTLPHVMGLYLKMTLNLFGQEKLRFEEETERKRIQHRKAIETETARYTDQIKHLQNNGKSHYIV